MSRRATLAAALVPALFGTAVAAERSGLDIMREVDQRQRAQSRTNVGALEVKDRRGKVSRKRWRFWAEGQRGESKVLVLFSDPPEVKGVGLLTLNHVGRPAEQWLYTPAIQRDRRIAAQERSARFMGTDFSNEDMQERGVESYEYERLGDDTLDGQGVHKISATARDPGDTQYSRLVFWVRKDIMGTVLTEFYVGRELRKTLAARDWQQIQGIWTPTLMEMKDVTAGSSTRVQVSEIRYNVTFEPDWFTLRNLRRDR